MSKKLTQEDFIVRSAVSHGTQYDYSEAEYLGRTIAVKITCREHGTVFWQPAGLHMDGQTSCPECILAKKMASRLENRRSKVPEGFKQCSKCNIIQPLDNFPLQPTGADGRYCLCRGCCSARYRKLHSNEEWRLAANAENRSYYEDNKESVGIRTAAYQKANRPLYNKAGRKWNQANTDKVNIKVSQRRASKLRAIPSWADDEWDKFVVAETYHLSRLRSEMLGTKFNVDHAIPLQSKYVCGLHCAANLQILTFQENIVKGNRVWPDMWLDSDFNISDNAATQTH